MNAEVGGSKGEFLTSISSRTGIRGGSPLPVIGSHQSGRPTSENVASRKRAIADADDRCESDLRGLLNLQVRSRILLFAHRESAVSIETRVVPRDA